MSQPASGIAECDEFEVCEFAQCTVHSSVKPFVCRVKFGEDDDEYFHASHGFVPDPGRDDEGLQWLHRYSFTIQFHGGVRTTFQNHVGFGQSSVIVSFGVF